MVYISSIKLLLNFESTSLTESVSGEIMNIVGNKEVEILENEAGYCMKQDQFVYLDNINLGVSGAMTMGFWFYSVNKPPGVVGANKKSIEVPVLDLESKGENFLSIKEFSHEENFNNLEVIFSGTKISSSNYTGNLWHHFWMVYDGAVTSLDIYIDGSLEFSTSGSPSADDYPPSTLNAASSDIYINRNTKQASEHRMNNLGYIGEIVVFNEAREQEDMQRLINYKIDSFTTTEYARSKKNYAILFNDPSTLTINSSIDDLTYMYIVSNDGKILRGSPLFWESRKDYSDSKEMQFLRENAVGTDAELASNVDGFLRVSNSVIRL